MSEEKLNQAAAILHELGIDAWLLLGRETEELHDPSLPLLLETNVTWPSAFILTARGERIAIVGRYDVDNVRAAGGWPQVTGYDQSLRPPLRDTLARLNPGQIAINYSTGDATADGLTHGLWLWLQDALAGTSFTKRLVTGEGIVAALRGRKTPSELGALRRAITTTEEIFRAIAGYLRAGRSGLQVRDYAHKEVRRRGLATAWDAAMCPIVTVGPESAIGHVRATDHALSRGELMHLDFGVRQDGFCSDLQRTWYLRRRGEKKAPDEVQRAFDAVLAAIRTGHESLRPGITGWQVDAAARRAITGAGYPEYQHALGHGLGRSTHDGATLLGPRWERYGRTPYGVVEAGNVFTLELGAQVAGYGFIGLEEDVLVTPAGCEYMSTPQTEIWYA
ncbi:MAG: aminopeptidase P family protein [Anaerolineae bacterium]|nr:aminopeptidase P family protein [Anaerolineae bacterium]